MSDYINEWNFNTKDLCCKRCLVNQLCDIGFVLWNLLILWKCGMFNFNIGFFLNFLLLDYMFVYLYRLQWSYDIDNTIFFMEPNCYKRGRRKDNVSQESGAVSIFISDDELDPWTAWAYKPRTITLLFIGSCFLM